MADESVVENVPIGPPQNPPPIPCVIIPLTEFDALTSQVADLQAQIAPLSANDLEISQREMAERTELIAKEQRITTAQNSANIAEMMVNDLAAQIGDAVIVKRVAYKKAYEALGDASRVGLDAPE